MALKTHKNKTAMIIGANTFFYKRVPDRHYPFITIQLNPLKSIRLFTFQSKYEQFKRIKRLIYINDGISIF